MSTLRKKYQAAVLEDMKEKAARVTGGRCVDFTDYRAACAELVGMHNAVQTFIIIEDKYSKEDSWVDFAEPETKWKDEE